MGKYVASQVFNATGIWVCPPGVTLALCVGFGGGGGSSSSGAGGGSLLQSQLVQVVPGTAYTVTVGAAGSNSGTDGGATTFGGSVSFAGGKGSTSGIGGANGIQTNGDPNAPQSGGSSGIAGSAGYVNAYTGGAAAASNGGGGAGGGGNGAAAGTSASTNTGAGGGGGTQSGGSGQLTVYWWPGMASQAFSANGTWVAPAGYAGPVLCIGAGGTTTSLTQYSIFQATPGLSYTVVVGSGVTTTVKQGSTQVFGAFANTGGSNQAGSVTLYWWPAGRGAVQTYTANGKWIAPPGYADPVLLWGFGGGGSGGSGYNSTAGGGGSTAQLVAVVPVAGQSYTVTVGAGGTGVAGGGSSSSNGNNGNPGGATSFGSLASFMGGQAGQGWVTTYGTVGPYPGAPDTAHAIGSKMGTGSGGNQAYITNQRGWGGVIYSEGNYVGITSGQTSWQNYAGGNNGTTNTYVGGGGGGGGPGGTGTNGGNGASGGGGTGTSSSAAAANTGAGSGGGGGAGSAGNMGSSGNGGSGLLVVAWWP